MKWTKYYNWSSVEYCLKDYPFFESTIKECNGIYTAKGKNFESLESAKLFVIAKIKKDCIKLLGQESADIDFLKYDCIVFRYEKFCGNTGYGKYISNSQWLKYQWIKGVPLKNVPMSQRYAIRFDGSLCPNIVIKKGVAILKRHARRFLKNDRPLG